MFIRVISYGINISAMFRDGKNLLILRFSGILKKKAYMIYGMILNILSSGKQYLNIIIPCVQTADSHHVIIFTLKNLNRTATPTQSRAVTASGALEFFSVFAEKIIKKT